VAAQVGSGNHTDGTTGAIQIQPTTAGATVAAKAGRLAPIAHVHVAISGDEVLGDTLGVHLAQLTGYPGSATAFVVGLVHSLLPGVPAEQGLERLIDAGVLQLGDGDDVRIDLGALTIQIVSLVRNPHVRVHLLGTTLDAGALAGVPNSGVPTATDSLGVAQGGGNTATDSIGAAQVGSLILAPHAGVRNDGLGIGAALGGASGVAGGGNSSTGSVGVVQIGPTFVGPTLGTRIDRVG